MKKILTIFVLTIFTVTLTACGREAAVNINGSDTGACLPGEGCDSGLEKYQGVNVNEQIPNFELTKADGSQVKLYDLIKGKKRVILDLSADWCVDCQNQNEALNKYYNDIPEDTEVIVVYAEFNSASGDKAKTTNQKQMLDYVKNSQKDVSYPVFYDKDNIIQDTLGPITATPKNYILDENGIIKGVSEEIDLKHYIDFD